MSKVSDLLTDLAACLCVELDREGVAPLCFCGVVHGDAAAQDYMGTCAGKCGMAWVRLAAAYPSETVGQQVERPNDCGAFLGLDIEIAVMRCTPMPDARGNPPSAAAIADAMLVQTDDLLAVRKAIQCCSSLDSNDYMLGTYTPSGPMGGLVGGAWSLSVSVNV